MDPGLSEEDVSDSLKGNEDSPVFLFAEAHLCESVRMYEHQSSVTSVSGLAILLLLVEENEDGSDSTGHVPGSCNCDRSRVSVSRMPTFGGDKGRDGKVSYTETLI